MSGIAGIYYLDGRAVSREVIAAMMAAIAHRGPDDSGNWYQGSVGLGHCLLRTTPESFFESSPQISQDAQRVITADARIDNREALLSQLALPQHLPKTLSDSEIILAAYEKWGEECPEQLVGDFAFAIWDLQAQRLFCARDHLGVKPFYYFRNSSMLAIASEIKALLSLPEVPCQLNEAQVVSHLTLNLEAPCATAYENIWRLPAAHKLSLSTKALRDPFQMRRYWQLDPNHEIQLDSDAAYEAAFRTIFEEAVRCRLRSAFPVGSHLSGGLDSSSIVCTARQLLKGNEQSALHTFSNIYPNVPGSDERAFIDEVVAQGDVVPHYVEADRCGPLSHYDEIFRYLDESIVGNGYLIWGLNQAAAKQNVRAVLNGFDGDTTVSHGILRLQELAEQGHSRMLVSEVKKLMKNLGAVSGDDIRNHGLIALRRLAKNGRWIAFLWASWQLSPSLNVSFPKLVFELGVKKLVPHKLKSGLKQWQNQKKHGVSQGVESMPNTLIQSDFAQRAAARSQDSPKHTDVPQTCREKQCQSFSGGITAALEVVDLLSASFKVEPRYPFMDKRLIEFCLALPAEQKLKYGWTRSILRRAMQDVLPERVQWRTTKTTPEAAFIHGLKTYDSKLIDTVIDDDRGLLEPYVDVELLRHAYQSFIDEKNDIKISIGTIWAAISLGLWLSKKELE